MAKTVTLTIKVNPEEKELVKKEAEKMGMTVSSYLHSMLFLFGDAGLEISLDKVVQWYSNKIYIIMGDTGGLALYNNFPLRSKLLYNLVELSR